MDAQKFLNRIYWSLGLFCLTWSGLALSGITRRREVTLFILGHTKISETIIFTLVVFSALLPVLLLVVGVFRVYSAKHSWSMRFPALSGDGTAFPTQFKWLQTVIYFGLVILPVGTMAYCCARMPQEMKIIDLYGTTKLEGSAIFGFPKASGAGRPDWRWIETQTPEGQSPRLSAYPPYEPWAFVLICGGCCVTALIFLFTPVRPQTSRVQGCGSTEPAGVLVDGSSVFTFASVRPGKQLSQDQTRW